MGFKFGGDRVEYFNIILNQVFFFSTCLAVGFTAQRIGFITDDMVFAISKFMMKVIIPIMVLTLTASSGTRSELISVWPFGLCVIGMYIIHFAVSFLSGKILGLKKPEINSHICSCAFVNSALIGYPIIMAMFPEKSGLFIAVFLIVETVVTWTVGVMILSSAKGKGEINLKKMVTPMTIGLVIGLIMVVIDIHPNNIFWNTLTNIGAMQKYLGLIYLGADIGRRGFKKLFAKPKVLFTVPIKLLVVPLCVFFVLHFIGMAEDIVRAVTVFSMLPTMLIITILTAEYDAAPDYGSGAILATTVCCLATMPAVFYIISFF